MSEFTTQIEINAPADDVFSYVTDISRMPEYMPTLQDASAVGDGKIRMKGEVKGHSYDRTGWFQTHEFNRTMLWGSDGDNQYSGDLEVVDQHGTSVLHINLMFGALPDMSDEDRKKLEAHAPQIQQGLDESAAGIKKACEAAFASVSGQSKGYVS